jgi:hypothetical protein
MCLGIPQLPLQFSQPWVEGNLGANLRRQPERKILRAIDSARILCRLPKGDYCRDVELLFGNPRIDFALKGVTVELDPGKLSILRVKPYFADLDPHRPSAIKFG